MLRLMPAAPSETELVAELIRLRDEGLPRLRQLELPALTAAARTVTLDAESSDHVVVEALVRRGVSRFGGGRYGDAAVALFGLDAGTRGENSRIRREIAAEAFGRTYETFRKKQEPLLIAQLATQIQVLCSEQHSRDRRAALERAESPEASTMPAVWLERFAFYYRIWSAVSGLANDLNAYYATRSEEERPWDRRFGTEDSDDPGYSQEEQAEGYATFALYHYAHFAWLLRQFVILYGGQWLLSDAAAEQAVASAVHDIWRHSPCNERDDSFLRTLIADTPEQEMHGFIQQLRSTELGRTTEREWIEWVDGCGCESGAAADARRGHAPTERQAESPVCGVHRQIEACTAYVRLIDADWMRLADWYRAGKTP
jgi:hypothetical protein